MKTKKINNRIRYGIVCCVAAILFLCALCFPITSFFATTGYHMEYHGDHEWEYVGIVYDYDVCSCGSNSLKATRQKYVYKCDDEIFKTAFWSLYYCSSCTGSFGESVMFNGHFPGDGTPAGADVTLAKSKTENDYDNFKENFLPDTQECPGYEVLNTYEIAYKPNGGSGTMENSSHTYSKSKKLTANAYTKEGYRFDGWNTKKDGSGDTYSNKESVKNLTTKNNATVRLYAQWEAKQYTVTFDPNGGSVPTTEKNVTYDSTYGTLPTPERKGFTFKGWYTKSTSGDRVKKGTSVSIAKNHTLYAQWTENEYTVTYNANEGTTLAQTAIYNYGDEVNLSQTASKDGYTFVGWATSPNASQHLTSFTMPDLATSENADYSSDWEVTLYAIYTIEVSDVSNHTYPSYNKIHSKEVDLVVWKNENGSSYKTYPFIYTGDAAIMYYAYKRESTDVSSFIGSSSYEYAITACDNAGNFSSIGGKPPMTEFYWQTVKHHYKDIASNTWIQFDTVNVYVEKGTTFTPAYITPPTGYESSQIDSGTYVITGAKTTNAYYIPKTYTLYFEPNGGKVSPTSKNIRYSERYGYMPIPERTGYTFDGWFSSANGGTEIKESDIYSANGNSTVYAHWTANSYHVIYDYWTNGGSSSSKTECSVIYGDPIDVAPKCVTASKAGWTFVGWNTNPDATIGLSSLTMWNKDVTLYAIYKKDITATFIDGSNKAATNIMTTIYNRTSSCQVTTPFITTIKGWNALGWSFDVQGNATIHVSPNVTYELSEDKTFYACYVQDITISYDTNGSAQIIPSQTKERYYNAAGSYVDPSFTIAREPTLDRHSFVIWEEIDEKGEVVGNYTARSVITADHSMTLTAKWDQYPEIEAYDRYFTLEEAINGEITADRLFEKVTATDKEDGLLINGTAVIIPDLGQYDFVNKSKVTITYQAKDSFGNIVEKSVTIHIVDTTITQSPTMYYSRFINLNFYKDNNSFIPFQYGGLESTSIWKTKETYQRLLEYALNNTEPINSFVFPKEELKNMKIQP